MSVYDNSTIVIVRHMITFQEDYSPRKSLKTQWFGKKAVMIGDSLTQMHYWEEMFAQILGMNYEVVAQSGGNMTAIANFIDNIDSADVMTVWAGTNDWYNGISLGSLLNNDNNTYYGAVQHVCERVSERLPWSNTGNSEWQIGQQWSGAYNIAPDVFLPQYSDGSWGMYPLVSNTTNSAENISLGGTMQLTTTRINTDFTLEQDLKFITKGLSARATVSWDNIFVENNRGINDLFNSAQRKWIDPDTGQVRYAQSYDTNNGFDWTQGVNWSTSPGAVDNSQTVRNLYYQAQLNWMRSFGKHDVTAMGLFSRQENARGSVMPTYREDWAFRVTYNYADRYFIEYNGAYNGSEKFSPENRFAFFNSGAIGWMISEEPFMKFFREKKIIDMLKVRASYGEIGSDQLGPDPFDSSRRWLYMNQWAYGGHTTMDLNHTESIYTWYRESAIGNQDIQWEVVKKMNIGVGILP